MCDSARMAWVKRHARELIEVAATCGAQRVCLCGSVARGEDTFKSDIDLYVWEFEKDPPGATPERSARDRAEDLVPALRAVVPYKLDVLGIPGWFLDPPFEESMQVDSIPLSTLAD